MEMATNMFRRFLLICALVAAASAHATVVLPLYLDEIIDKAAVAFEGTAIESHSEREFATGLVVTFTTFRVDDVLKGQVGSLHTIKQVGGTIAAEGPKVRILGMPSYRVGQKYVMFLTGISQAGFSSPIGLQQGRFVVDDDGGASNGRDFGELTRRMPETRPKGARGDSFGRTMGLEEFKQVVRQRVWASR